MGYKIAQLEPDLVLKQGRATLVMMVCLVTVGILFLLLGVAATLGPEPVRSGYIFLGFGVIFTIIPWVFISRRKLQPRLFQFSNADGMIYLKNKEQVGHLSYEKVKGFETITRNNWHPVILRKKDHSFFELNQFSKREKALVYMKKLYEAVDLEKGSTYTPPHQPLKKVILDKSGRFHTYSWRLSSIKAVFTVLPVVAGFAASFYGFNLSGLKLYLGSAFLGVICLLALYSLVGGIINRYMVTIDQKAITFAIKRFGRVKPKRSMAVSDVAAVFFNFSSTQGETGLFIVNEQERQKLAETARLASDQPANTMDKIELATATLSHLFAFKKLMRIDIHDLSIFEKLAIEQSIEESLRTFGAKTLSL